jgi:hypothetical protein
MGPGGHRTVIMKIFGTGMVLVIGSATIKRSCSLDFSEPHEVHPGRGKTIIPKA